MRGPTLEDRLCLDHPMIWLRQPSVVKALANPAFGNAGSLCTDCGAGFCAGDLKQLASLYQSAQLEKNPASQSLHSRVAISQISSGNIP
jgi:hypothetical protein